MVLPVTAHAVSLPRIGPLRPTYESAVIQIG